MSSKRCKIAVLLSGAGSTMVNLQNQIDAGLVNAQIEVVVSSRKNVLGLERAENFGIATRVLSRRPFKKNKVFDGNAYSQALYELIRPFAPDLVVMAGFMTRLEPPLLDRLPVVNVHPALLPMFGGEGYYGHYVHEAVIDGGLKITGATVHFADALYDHGPIIMQEAVEVREDDTTDTLAARVQEAERRIYPKAIAAFAEGRLKIQGGKVRVADKKENQ